MNRIFRTLWSHSLQAWVVTSELAKSGGKRGGGRAVGLLLLAPLGAGAANLPSGGAVVSGSGHLSSTGQQLTVDQSSPNLAIDWQSFDIGAGHGVTFHQPSSQAVALNRVVGQDASRILGNLSANGRVFLVNPNGILFGQGASVNVGGLVASTLDIANSDFEQGRYHFKSQSTPKAVINQGSIQAKNGGAVALLGGRVSNQGVIVANGGSVALAAGQAMTLDFAGDGLLSVKVDEATADALAENRELIRANGGQVLLTAHASDALLKTVVNNSGVIEAQTLAERGGKIELLGGFDGGTVQVAGTLDASAPKGGNGGFVETSGAHVQVAEGTRITTKASQGQSGTWLLDPTDFTVSAGSAAASTSGIGASTLAANLENGNVTLQTVSSSNGSDTGKLSVNSAVNWSANTTLTLNAHGDLYLNAPITATGTSAGLVLNYGGYIQNSGSVTAGSDYHVSAPVTLSGSNASLSINGQGYGLLHSLADIQAINTNGLGGNYALAQDLDAAGTTYNSALVGSFRASNGVGGPFSGNFAGLGHTVANLSIVAPTSYYLGLFARVAGSVRDLDLTNVQISGKGLVGGLTAFNSGTLSNIQVSGDIVAAYSSAGGMVYDNYGTIRNSSSSGSVTVLNTTGNASGSYAGGLVGANNGTLDNTYSSSNVFATSAGSSSIFLGFTGGLVGVSTNGTISYSYATGNVAGTVNTGGLVGTNQGDGASISNSYATGRVTGTSNVGGLVGTNSANISNAYWDSDSTGQSNAIGRAYSWGTVSLLNSVNSSNRYNASAYANLAQTFSDSPNRADMVRVGTDASGTARWIILDGNTRPFLASEYSTQISNLHQLQLMAYDSTANYGLIRNIDASATASGGGSSLWSSQGFVPLGQAGELGGIFNGTFDGRNLTISGLTQNGGVTGGLFSVIGNSGVVQNLGLVGGSITSSSGATGAIAGGNSGLLQNVFATTSVTGQSYTGGLVGINFGQVLNAYSTGTVQGSLSGGIVGLNSRLGRISNTYAGGSISGSSSVGGIAGGNGGSIQSSFYALSNAVGTSLNIGLATVGQQQGTLDALSGGKTWAQLTNLNTYSGAGWSLDATGGTSSTWRLYAGSAAPLLRSFLTPLSVSVSGDKTYDGSASSGSGYASSIPGVTLLGSLSYSSTSANAGTYSTAAGNLTVNNQLYSTQLGYDIITQASSLTITPKTLSGSITAQDKTYDGTTAATVAGSLTGVIAGDQVQLGSAQFADKNAGSNKAVSVALTGTAAGNYRLDASSLVASILAKSLTGSITAQNKTYDGTTATTTVGVLAGAIAGDAVSLTTSGSFADKNVGNGKPVTVSGVLSGTDAGNYRLASANTTSSASITPKALTGTITAQDKIYDGTAVATTSGTLDGVIAGDAVSLATTGSFADKNAGAGKTVNVSGSLGGTDAANYRLNVNALALADINRAPLTITALDASKTAGQLALLNGFNVAGLVPGDTLAGVTLASPGADTAAGPGNYAILPSAASGLGLGNYLITYRPGVLTVQGLPVALAVPLAAAQLTSNTLVQERQASTTPATGASSLRLPPLDTPRTNSLSGLSSLDVVNRGIRLPEGI